MRPQTQFVATIAGRRLAIEGDEAAARLRPAFARLEDPCADGAEATLTIRTSADPARSALFDGLTTGFNRGADGSLIVIEDSPPVVETWRPGAHPRLTLDISPQALDSGDRLAQPAHVAIGAWTGANGEYWMHAAGLALGDRGVLLLGAGGRGKTTTALACAARGLSFLGDDLCIAAPDRSGHARHMIHGVYATAKLNADSLARLGVADWRVLGMTPKGKTVVALPPEIGFARSCRLVACIGVEQDGGPYDLRLLSRTEALRRLAQGSTPGIGAFGPSGAWLSGLSLLARDVPIYSLGLGWDFSRLADIVSRLCAGEDPAP